MTPSRPTPTIDDPSTSNNADDPDSEAAITAAYAAMAAETDTRRNYEIARSRRQ